MNELHKSDLNHVLRSLPKDLICLMQHHGIVLGGGFIREVVAGNKPNDVDFFGASREALEAAARNIADSRCSKVVTTGNALTVVTDNRMPVQFITRWLFDDPAHVILSFDFTVCRAAIWFLDDAWHSAIGEDFYRDLAGRRLVYTHPQRNEDAGGSLLRVRKFLARGYTIQAASLAGVVARLAMAVRWDEGRVQTEEGATKIIAGLLYEVDPLYIVDGVDVTERQEEI